MPDFAMASMGAGCFVLEDNQVLLVRLNYGPAKGQFIMPGGMVEKDEHPHQAALRELGEETGLSGKVISQVAVRHRIDKKGRLNIYWVFACENTSDKGTKFTFPQDEIQEVVFMNIQQAIISPEVRPNTRQFLKLAFEKSNNELIENYNESYKDFIYT